MILGGRLVAVVVGFGVRSAVLYQCSSNGGVATPKGL